MATKQVKPPDRSAELLTDLMIVQLGLARVPQHSIRAIVGCDMNRVTRIVKHLKTKTAN